MTLTSPTGYPSATRLAEAAAAASLPKVSTIEEALAASRTLREAVDLLASLGPDVLRAPGADDHVLLCRFPPGAEAPAAA